MNEQNNPQGQGFWKEHFASWKASGLTQKAYCSREGISYQSFIYQHNRGKIKLKKSGMTFVEATLKPREEPIHSSGVQVLFPNGIRIGFGHDLSVEVLHTVFSLAGTIKC